MLVFEFIGFLDLLLAIYQYFEEICKYLDALFDLPFHEIDNALGEVAVQAHSFGAVIVIISPLNVIICIQNVPLLQEYLRYFEESIPTIKLMNLRINFILTAKLKIF